MNFIWVVTTTGIRESYRDTFLNTDDISAITVTKKQPKYEIYMNSGTIFRTKDEDSTLRDWMREVMA